MRRLFPALLLIACDDHLYGTTSTACREDAPLTWENFGRAFLDDRCTGCHSSMHTGDDRSDAPEDVNFDTWDGILIWAERARVRTIESQTMPPTGGLSAIERAMFDEWLRCEVFPAAGVL